MGRHLIETPVRAVHVTLQADGQVNVENMAGSAFVISKADVVIDLRESFRHGLAG